MHKHGKYRHRHRMIHPWKPFHGFFWLFLLAFFFLGGRWWPAILILVGLSMLLGALFEDRSPQPSQDLPPVKVPMPPPVPASVVANFSPVTVEPTHRTDLLPTTCPQCGGPVNSHEVRWTGKQSAACPYCGSALPMKNG